jgi:hypothetical protein
MILEIMQWVLLFVGYIVIGHVISGCDCDGFIPYILRLIFWPIYLPYAICGFIYEGIRDWNKVEK